jgi:DivIVA domain-containing protein
MAADARPDFDPKEIARATFPTAFRGYDQDAVRRYLGRLATAVGRAQSIGLLGSVDAEQAANSRQAELEIEASELQARVAELEALLEARPDPGDIRAPSPVSRDLDEAELIELLGEETARVLEQARSAGAGIVKRAETEAASITERAEIEARATLAAAESTLTSAEAEAEESRKALALATRRSQAKNKAEIRRVRELAQTKADEILAEAARKAEQDLTAAQSRANQAIAEAEQMRDDVLGELVRRHQLYEQQLERMSSARDRLGQALAIARSELETVSSDIDLAGTSTAGVPLADQAEIEAETRAKIEAKAKAKAEARVPAAELPVENLVAQLSSTAPVGIERVRTDSEAFVDDLLSARSETVSETIGAEPDQGAAAEVGIDLDGSDLDGSDLDGDGDTGDDELDIAIDELSVDGHEPDGLGLDDLDVDDGDADDPDEEEVDLQDLDPLAEPDDPGTGGAESATDVLDADDGLDPAEASAVDGDARQDGSGATDDGLPVEYLEVGRDRQPLPDEESGFSIGGITERSVSNQNGITNRILPPEVDVRAEEQGLELDLDLDRPERTHLDLDFGAVPPAGPAAGSLHRAVRGDLPRSVPYAGQLPAAFEGRDIALTRATPGFRRRLKRAVNDDQSLVLDRLRAGRGTIRVDELPDYDEQLDGYLGALRPSLFEVVKAGSELGNYFEVDQQSIDTLCLQLGRHIVDSLRRPTTAAIESTVDHDREAILDPVRATYRDFRNSLLPSLIDDALHEAFASGLFAAIEDDEYVLWLTDPRLDPDPICEENSAAPPLLKGTGFPSGHIRPLSMPGCRCLAIPAP